MTSGVSGRVFLDPDSPVDQARLDKAIGDVAGIYDLSSEEVRDILRHFAASTDQDTTHQGATDQDTTGQDGGQVSTERYALRWAASGTWQWREFDSREDLLTAIQSNRDYLYDPDWARGAQVWRLDTPADVLPAGLGAADGKTTPVD